MSTIPLKTMSLLALLAAAAATPALARDAPGRPPARSCHDTTLKNNIYNGEIIRTNDGYVFKVDPFSQFDTEFWAADDDLQVCAVKHSVDGKDVTRYILKDSYSFGDDPGGAHATLYSGPKAK